MMRRINEIKSILNKFCVIVNANLMVPHVSQVKNGIIINANVIVKSVARAKKIKFGIVTHVFVRIIGISKVLFMIQ